MKTKIIIVVPTVFIASVGRHVEQGHAVLVTQDEAKSLVMQNAARYAPKVKTEKR